MSEQTKQAHLHRAALRSASHASFLASLLLPFAEEKGLTWNGLADYLVLTPAALDKLALCGKPDGEHREAGITHLAQVYGIERDKLAEIIGNA